MTEPDIKGNTLPVILFGKPFWFEYSEKHQLGTPFFNILNKLLHTDRRGTTLELIAAKTEFDMHLGNLLASHYRSPAAIQQYVSFLQQLGDADVSLHSFIKELLGAKFVSSCRHFFRDIPAVHYTLANCELLADEQYQVLAADKKSILKHILTLPEAEKINALGRCLDETTSLGKVFYTKATFEFSKLSYKSGILAEVFQALFKRDPKDVTASEFEKLMAPIRVKNRIATSATASCSSSSSSTSSKQTLASALASTSTASTAKSTKTYEDMLKDAISEEQSKFAQNKNDESEKPKVNSNNSATADNSMSRISMTLLQPTQAPAATTDEPHPPTEERVDMPLPPSTYTEHTTTTQLSAKLEENKNDSATADNSAATSSSIPWQFHKKQPAATATPVTSSDDDNNSVHLESTDTQLAKAPSAPKEKLGDEEDAEGVKVNGSIAVIATNENIIATEKRSATLA